MESPPTLQRSAPVVHSYREPWGIAKGILCAVAIVGVWILFCPLPRIDPTGHRHVELGSIAIVTAVCAVVFTAQVSLVLRRLNECLIIADERIIVRSRFGRTIAECPFSDVISWHRVNGGMTIGPFYSVTLRDREIRYSGEISRRAELDRLFRALSGERLEAPEPAPRRWTGQTVFRCRFGAVVFLPILMFLCCVAVLYVSLRDRFPGLFGHPVLWETFVFYAAVFLAFSIRRYLLGSVNIEAGMLVYRNQKGKERRVAIDDVESVDRPFGGRDGLLGARVYASGQSLRLDPDLGGYDELVYQLQRLTAGPNP